MVPQRKKSKCTRKCSTGVRLANHSGSLVKSSWPAKIVKTTARESRAVTTSQRYLLIIRLLSLTTRTPLMGPPLTCRGLDIRPASYASLHRPLMESRTTNDILLIRNDRYLGLPRSFECASFVGPASAIPLSDRSTVGSGRGGRDLHPDSVSSRRSGSAAYRRDADLRESVLGIVRPGVRTSTFEEWAQVDAIQT